ncbi:MAG TPA: Flp pilus assembly complex ATPase component TadA [Clostridiales bacterium]|nr:Flp pilus assembly complex ATPase component TadA [Clostridiales bacterium]
MLNIFIIIVVILILIYFLYRFIKKDRVEIEDIKSENITENLLIEGVKLAFDEILNKNVADLNLNKNETLKRENMKSIIRKSLRVCCHGDKGAKEYIKDYIKDIIQRKYQINELNIDNIIDFDNPNNLNSQDKFEILIYKYKKEFRYEGLKKLIDKYELDRVKRINKEEFYDITENDINKIYQKEAPNLSYVDKLEIIAQRIYQRYKGLGVIDEIRDMKIDGVSGGISGIPNDFYSYELDYFNNMDMQKLNSFNSVWMFYKGKTIRLSFLGFGSQRELIRVCKNIYRHGNPGQLSQAKGFIANEMKDGSRVVTFRPPFSASWAFLVRKFDSIERKDIQFLITDPGCEMVILLIEFLVKTYQDIIITGSQGCGKTTLMMSLLQFFNRNCNLRVYELIFELFPQKIYPDMNVLSLRETDTVFGQDALDIIKKTDGDVTMIGEIATYEAANWLVETSQVASKCVLATHHAVTTEDLVDYFRNAALRHGGFNDERIAEEQVIKAINFDIHMVKDRNGYRYIERITEIVAVEDDYISDDLNESMHRFFRRMSTKAYRSVDIVKFSEGKYHIVNPLSESSKERMSKYMEEDKLVQLYNKMDKAKESFAYE